MRFANIRIGFKMGLVMGIVIFIFAASSAFIVLGTYSLKKSNDLLEIERSRFLIDNFYSIIANTIIHKRVGEAQNRLGEAKALIERSSIPIDKAADTDEEKKAAAAIVES
jgi:hypothetical protein